jgi:hypothetical protein
MAPSVAESAGVLVAVRQSSALGVHAATVCGLPQLSENTPNRNMRATITAIAISKGSVNTAVKSL